MSSISIGSDPVGSGVSRIGAELRAARERLGWDLPSVAEVLRIRQPFLEAIESGRIAELPGNAYAVGFLRAYAAALGLDPDETTRRFKSEAAEVNRKVKLVFPAPAPERGVPAGAVLLIGLVVAIVAYAVWYRMSAAPSIHNAAVPPVPARLAAKIPPFPASPIHRSRPAAGAAHLAAAPTVAAPPTAASRAAATPAIPPSVTTSPAPSPTVAAALSSATPSTSVAAPALPTGPAPAASATPAVVAAAPSPPVAPVAPAGAAPVPDVAVPPAPVPVVQAPLSPAPATPAATTTPATTTTASTTPTAPSGPSAGGSTSGATPAAPASTPGVALRATADSWIEVRDSSGKILFSGILHPGDSWTVPPGQTVTMTIGNAGGTELVVNGKVSPPLGASGQVRRNLTLDPATLASGALGGLISPAAAATPPVAPAPSGQ